MGEGRAGTDERDEEAFVALRSLIVGREREQLDLILARLDDHEARRRDVGEVLPAVLLEHAADPRFTHALTPPVERAITASVRSNPGPLADALFPVMGPAIRKAVAAALSGMVEGLNRTLEHSLSWRSLVWRVEALRSGKSFGEVMLLHTLVYRVEQVFLIEPASGILLQHVAEGPGEVKDADMVSGMLTAIREFVKDSFRVTDGEGLEALRVGELSIWIEQGPSAIIAAVLRGNAPRSYRTTLQTALERIHLEFADEFDHFRGDTAPFDAARPLLESCVHVEYQARAKRGHRPLWIAAALGALIVLAWFGMSVRANRRWNHYLDTLRAEPGIVVVSAGRRSGRYAVSGLRDPLARDPASLLADASLTPADVDARWEFYHASATAIAATRARQVLQPPAGVTLTLNDGVLTPEGTAPAAWLADAARLAPLIPGVSRFDASAAVDAAIRSAIDRLQAFSPLFVKGQALLAPGQDDVLRQLVSTAGELARAAAATSRRYRLDVIGHTDADGAPQANLPLSRARAAVVRAAIAPVAADAIAIVDAGVGSDDPAVRSDREADKQRNRRVTVRVTPVSPEPQRRATRP